MQIKFIVFFLFLISSTSYANVNWEKIPAPRGSTDLMRLYVPHGWLVSYQDYARGITYIPDEGHTWKINISTELNEKLRKNERGKSDIFLVIFICIWINAGITLLITSSFRK